MILFDTLLFKNNEVNFVEFSTFDFLGSSVIVLTLLLTTFEIMKKKKKAKKKKKKKSQKIKKKTKKQKVEFTRKRSPSIHRQPNHTNYHTSQPNQTLMFFFLNR